MPKCLVTGGMGFIGSNLSLSLEKKGYEVLIADYHVEGATAVEGFKGEVREIDVSREFEIEGGFDVVFHQASLTDPRYENDQEMYDSNLRGFENVVGFCRKKGAKLIYASTAGLYGNGSVPMKEDQPKELLTAYARSKLKMDHRVETLANEMTIIGLRYFNVFGPHEARKGRAASMIYHLSKQINEGKAPRIFKDGTQIRDHIYVKDVVEANLRCLCAPSGVYNVGTGVGTSFNQLVVVINEVLGTKGTPEYFDMPFAPDSYQRHTLADTQLAASQLGFTSKWKIKDAVADYLKWLGWVD